MPRAGTSVLQDKEEVWIPQADEWLYDRFVQWLDPGDYDPRAGLLRGLAATLPHRRKPGSRMRIGVGSAVLVTATEVVVAADVVPVREPSASANWSVDWQALDVRSSYRMQTALILEPPAAPFLFVAFGKKVDIRGTLRVSLSPDVIEVCGDGAATIRRRPVIAAYRDLDGVPLDIYRRASALAYARGRDPRAKELREAMERLVAKHGAVAERALQVAINGPRRHTAEYDALARLLAARAREDADAR
jgi:hypothetical protein